MQFTKMHGCGNDYIYVNCLGRSNGGESVANPSNVSVRVSDRHFGIGSDGLILILPSKVADFRMRMFNADGSEGAMCGNGIRCIGKFVYDNKLTKKRNISIETKGGVVTLKICRFNRDKTVMAVEVNMGSPRPIPKHFYVKADGKATMVKDRISVRGRVFDINFVSIGNPHCVIFVKNVANFPIERFGPLLERHKNFPSKTNVEFVEIINSSQVKQRTWERGSGETLACGSGACAVTAVLRNQKNANKVTIRLMGGRLDMRYSESGDIYMMGPAVKVCDGDFNL